MCCIANLNLPIEVSEALKWDVNNIISVTGCSPICIQIMHDLRVKSSEGSTTATFVEVNGETGASPNSIHASRKHDNNVALPSPNLSLPVLPRLPTDTCMETFQTSPIMTQGSDLCITLPRPNVTSIELPAVCTIYMANTAHCQSSNTLK